MKHNIGSGTKDQTVRLMIASSGIALGLFAKQRWLKALGSCAGRSVEVPLLQGFPLHDLAVRAYDVYNVKALRLTTTFAKENARQRWLCARIHFDKMTTLAESKIFNKSHAERIN
ncbi:MAG: hypothetical protein CXZ00_10990 [Acidobacteria bacterium]|nr:MAG: hypothetical protein CXZ00_10990 [Acidobacteriota bacterium]